jgi:hypothetical protein
LIPTASIRCKKGGGTYFALGPRHGFSETHFYKSARRAVGVESTGESFSHLNTPTLKHTRVRSKLLRAAFSLRTDSEVYLTYTKQRKKSEEDRINTKTDSPMINSREKNIKN